MHDGFVDIHCHILPGIDDGSPDWETSLAMARMAVEQGTRTIVATAHQLGNFAQNRGDTIRQLTELLQQLLDEQQVPLQVLPGGDVRIEDQMLALLGQGDVLSLADLRQHVLLELPHDLYFPLEGLLEDLQRAGMVGILSHPERNQGILRNPETVAPLVEAGCLMQVTAGSLMGSFGSQSQRLAERMLSEGLVHFVATDAHGITSRRPLMRRAFDRVVALTDEETAEELCSVNPGLVAQGKSVSAGRRAVPGKGWKQWFSRRKAG